MKILNLFITFIILTTFNLGVAQVGKLSEKLQKHSQAFKPGSMVFEKGRRAGYSHKGTDIGLVDYMNGVSYRLDLAAKIISKIEIGQQVNKIQSAQLADKLKQDAKYLSDKNGLLFFHITHSPLDIGLEYYLTDYIQVDLKKAIALLSR